MSYRACATITSQPVANEWIDRQRLSQGGAWGATLALEEISHVDYTFFLSRCLRRIGRERCLIVIWLRRTAIRTRFCQVGLGALLNGRFVSTERTRSRGKRGRNVDAHISPTSDRGF